MMSFTTHYDDDGFATVELNGPAEPVTEFSKELVDDVSALGVFMTRHRNTVTLHCSNGEWTYRLTAYNERRGAYRGELVTQTERA